MRPNGSFTFATLPFSAGARRLLALSLFAFAPFAVLGDTASFTGTLASSTDVFETTFSLPTSTAVTLQTYGFGGGMNAAGTPIASGGTDPFLAIFAGAGPTAAILTDGLGNPFGTSLDLGNYGGFSGCPPAGQLAIGGADVCGDITMSLLLPAGDYTVVLSDGQYQANAVVAPGATTLGDGFSDFTGGQFCNVLINGVNCPNTAGAYALDISGPPAAPVPEPPAVALILPIALGLAVRIGYVRRVRAARADAGSATVPGTIFIGLAALALAGSFASLIAPKALRAAVATLVQVTNSTANPVATLNTTASASQNVTLFCDIPGYCIALGPAGATAAAAPPPYVVPAGQNLVITDVEITPPGEGGIGDFQIFPVSASTGACGPPGFTYCHAQVWSYFDDATTKEFQFPSGIVYPEGFEFEPLGIQGTRAFLRGYLTAN
jgi:hypothetical protein